MATNRLRGFGAWNPQIRTKSKLLDMISIVENYRPIWPITGRQLFYRMVALYGYPKTDAAYKSLLELLNRARRAEMIPMEAIRDDGAVVLGDHHFLDADDFLKHVTSQARFCRLDLQQFQDQHLIVWCEAAGMAPQLSRVARPYGIDVRSSGGFDSTTVKHEAGELIGQMEKPVRIIHVGDMDPSGEHIHMSLGEDLAAFAEHYGNSDVTVDRVAVTKEQQEKYNLPTAPPKKEDKRSFTHNFTVQCEALPPDVLADIVKQAIEAAIDVEEWQAAVARQDELRLELAKTLSRVREQPKD
jgi:hypothetical protein